MENPFEENQTQRPTFLMVLCILTFIGSGWSVLSSLFSMFTADFFNGDMQINQYSSMMGDMQDQGVSTFLSGILSSSIEMMQCMHNYAREIAVFQLILYVISLLGAIMMFQLKRVGFYLYAAAQVLVLFVLPYFAGFSILVVTSMLFAGVFTLVFIVLYAVNLKYMTRTGLF